MSLFVLSKKRTVCYKMPLTECQQERGIMGLKSKNRKRILMTGFASVFFSWIEDNLDRKLTMDEISEFTGYSKWHFQRGFRDFFGMTLMAYIRGRKMTIAANLIIDAELSITDIFCMVGFYENSTFARAFRHHFGLSPKEMRGAKIIPEGKRVYPLDWEKYIDDFFKNLKVDK
ncbi:helix-turn-helix transcriptional regulator [Serratia nevei]|uniref:helix-turn-helix transcriptional regulator n=2 Tax=Serratia TaxID=613 RepID=UPI00217B1B8F|nr:Multiple antibiotic resistance protein marA [Serratia marcescens]